MQCNAVKCEPLFLNVPKWCACGGVANELVVCALLHMWYWRQAPVSLCGQWLRILTQRLGHSPEVHLMYLCIYLLTTKVTPCFNEKQN